ncbi:ATP-binding protein [Rossellomorea vietnamensis]|uniref:ATP-binding protein n=1 Tax=Rossellomorea vietnamensis TaxID=218284 RepID=A0A5D4MBY2_9BACI|nr:ATP-binding protein [Rossellomorea vietnamensis]TYR99232.1 ATP-binding protein [Rossellomorea vietnamensis]
MDRFLIMTIGKTHSGKSTFAKLLEKQLNNSLVIDQDHHADFINTHYKRLLPENGPNTLKTSITKSIVEYAVKNTPFHLILCNANLNRESRLKVLEYYHKKGFSSILVYFKLPDEVLEQRIASSSRRTNIFRSASTFQEVLIRQNQANDNSPCRGEADYLFEIGEPEQAFHVIDEILNRMQK